MTYLPHDSVNHFVDDFVNGDEKFNDGPSTFSKRSKNSSKCETKENDPEGIGSRSRNRCKNYLHL